MRMIASLATGQRYNVLLDRLVGSTNGEPISVWRDSYPDGSPTHQQIPYGFKAFILKGLSEKYETLLWLDSSVVILKSLEPLWELIERQGYWFSSNQPHNCGEWTCDSALAPLEISREEAFGIPQVMGTAFGLSMKHELSHKLLSQYFELAQGQAFCGPWANDRGQASPDKRVKGHRHDQTVLSVLAKRAGMALSDPPIWIADAGCTKPTEETLLAIRR